MEYEEVMDIIRLHPERISEIDPDWRSYSFSLLHLVCVHNGRYAHVPKYNHVRDYYGRTPLICLARYYSNYVPLLKWNEIPSLTNLTPRHQCTTHHHVLAKLRRLLGTLPAAYIRLVHNYT